MLKIIFGDFSKGKEMVLLLARLGSSVFILDPFDGCGFV
jgi:hypothetical protein